MREALIEMGNWFGILKSPLDQWEDLAQEFYEETGYLVEADQAWREALYWNPMMDGARRGAARTGVILRGLSL